MTGLGITGTILRTIYLSWESYVDRENVCDPHSCFEYEHPNRLYFDDNQRRHLLDTYSNIKKEEMTKNLVNKKLYQMILISQTL